MSQADIYEFLKENQGNKFTALDLIEKLPLNEQTVYSNLRRLKKTGMINIGKVVVAFKATRLTKTGIKKYKFKKKSEVYWIENKQESI